MNKLLCGLVSGVLACGSVYAEVVTFLPGQSAGTFHCTVSNIGATVKIDTSRLDLNGACEGQPYVVNPGHLVGVPGGTINDYWFGIKKSVGDTSSVTLQTSDGSSISCGMGHGDKSKAYGDGRYCVSVE